jgi:hydrogenase maturation protease
MSCTEHRILILGVGNDLLGDDAVGLRAARAVRPGSGDNVHVVELAASGFELIEYMEGFDKAILLDAVSTGKSPAGTILQLSLSEFVATSSVSPHFAGVSDALRMAERLEMNLPKTAVVLAVEIIPPAELGNQLTPPIAAIFPEYVARIKSILVEWGALESLPG